MLFYIWIGVVIFVAYRFQRSMLRTQERNIKAQTYVDEIVADGTKKRIARTKCPTCGNTDMGYQMVNSHALTRNSKNGRWSTTGISSTKYAVCSRCGASFPVIRRTTPFALWAFALVLSFILCAIVTLIILVVLGSVLAKMGMF